MTLVPNVINNKKDEKKLKELLYHYYDDKRPYICFCCNKNFEDYEGLRLHIVKAKKKIEDKYMEKLKKDGISDNLLNEMLSDKLKNDKNYRLLLKTEEGAKRFRPFVCGICGKNFRYKVSLKIHYKKTHNIDFDNENNNVLMMNDKMKNEKKKRGRKKKNIDNNIITEDIKHD